MKVLIVEDDPTNRLAMQAMLEHFGYVVITACDGADGVAMFELEHPDVVLMDIMMPVMNGYDATREIKRRCGNHFVPVIFVTALSGTDDLVKSIDAGGDDFLVRPFDVAILQAKLSSMHRIQGVYTKLETQEQVLEAHNSRLNHELQIGQHVLAKMNRKGISDESVLRSWISPLDLFCGDLLLSARTPAGGLHIMLGDITGHGLSAAIGAQPVVDMFYSMTNKGFSIGDIASEINRRLHETLYPEIFCAACLVELDEQRTTATIWNGAMPDVIIIDTVTGQSRCVTSNHQALGVRTDERFSRRAEIVSISANDVIILCSDGFIEARNDRGEKYGQAQFAQRAALVRDQVSGLPSLRASFIKFMGAASPADDVSLVEISCLKSAITRDDDAAEHGKRNVVPTHWQAQVVFHADALRTVNVVAVVANLITQVQSPPGHRERIFTVLTELLVNALDHGLLGLDSQLKSSPEGFAGYYLRRSQALAELREGWVRITLQHMPDENAGVLKIRIDDSGPGFDFARHNDTASAPPGTTLYRGRGIPLVRTLCHSVVFSGNGNRVEVVYRWAV